VKDANGNTIGVAAASSGVPGETDTSKKGEGPIPSGIWFLDPAEISPTNWKRDYLDPRDWGKLLRAKLISDDGQ